MQSYYEHAALVRGPVVHWELLENASTFPFQNWVNDVSSSQSGGSCISKFATFGPVDLGFPTLRLRLLGFQTDDPDMVWEGPPASDVTSHFLEIFGGCCPGMFAFDVGGIDSDDEREKLYRSYAKNRGIFGLPVGQKYIDLDLGAILPVCYCRHLKGYKEVASKSAEKVVLCDLATNPYRRPGRSGAASPTSTRNTALAIVCADGSDRRDMLLTIKEIDSLHGWPYFPQSERTTELQQCLPFADTSFSDRVMRNFTGNGQHLACMAAWFIYVASHVSFKAADSVSP